MSLVGNLEDLGLGDIAQIVSLSRKSGVLLIERGPNRAKVVFRNGMVLAAFTNTDRQDPAGRLVAQGMLDARAAAGARERHRAGEGAESILECLVAAGAPSEAAQEAVRAEIERAVLALFGWEDGDFSFDLKDVEEDLARIRAHPHRVLYEAGLNPQFLLMEASRIVDEARRSPKPTRADAENEALCPEIRRAAAVDSEKDRADLDNHGSETGHENRSAPDLVGARPPGPPPPPVQSASALTTRSPDGAAGTRLIVVDDDDQFLHRLAPELESWGYAIECFPGGGPAAERIEVLATAEKSMVVLSDLLMPRVDGGGLLGGIELLERVRRRFASLPFVLLADHLQEEAEGRARLLDVDFTIAKPRAAVLAEGPEGPAWRNFLGVLKPILESLHRLPSLPEAPRAARADAENEAPRPEIRRAAAVDPEKDRADAENEAPRPEIRRAAAVDPEKDRTDGESARTDTESAAPPAAQISGAEEEGMEGTIDLRRALGGNTDPDLFADGERPPERTTTPGLAILKSMLCELAKPEAASGGEITLLILRFAAEIMNRAVLFMVKGGEAIGLGGFGLGPGALREDARAARRSSLTRGAVLRRLRIRLDVPSVFHDAIGKRSVLRGRQESSLGNDRLRTLLGGVEPMEAFVAPIAAGDEVVALLYGDNLPDNRPVGDTEALEIFLTQAGLALEKAILERRLSETGRR